MEQGRAGYIEDADVPQSTEDAVEEGPGHSTPLCSGSKITSSPARLQMEYTCCVSVSSY